MCVFSLVSQLLLKQDVYHFTFLIFFFFFLIAAVQEVIHYHQIDLALLVVAGAVAEVTVEVAATGELWTVQFFDVS